MFRRSRFSVRPNVGTAGRTATSQEPPAASQDPSETPKEASESNSANDVTNKSVVSLSEKGDGNEPNGDGTNLSAALQRRKRFSIKPKVAPGRPSTLSRTPKSPVKAVSSAPVEVSNIDLSKPSTSSQAGTSAVPHGLQSPRRRRHSEDSKQHKMQPEVIPMSSEHSGPSPIKIAEDSPEQTLVSADRNKQAENISGRQVKDIPARPPDKVPPSLLDKETSEISEKAKTLVSSKNVLSLPPSALSLSKLLNSPSDLQRLVKAQKLRELLRQERSKEKKIKKDKTRAKEFTLDPTKMTMRDLIHYLPTSNPMMSSLEDSAQEDETVVPPSPAREESPERVQEPEVLPTKVSSGEEEMHEEEVAEEEADEEALMVPQVKVAEDGSLIIDEESLTVEVQRAKGPNPAQDRDPIFERGSTTTYSSFRKGTYTKPWSTEETDMFYLAVSMVGTDFSMICQLFPLRSRSEIKNKFKREERQNSWRIDKAFRERRKLDIEYFSKLLEKILEVQKDRKKLKSLSRKNSTKSSKTKAKGKKSERKLSDVEEEEDNEVPDLEEEAQKENEDQCNEGGSPAVEFKKKRKRKKKDDALTEELSGKKNKTDVKSNEQSEAGIPEDSEAALPENHINLDMTEKTPNVNKAKDTAVKPAKLSRCRAPKPLLPLGLKRGKKPAPSTKSKETVSEKEDECESDGASKEQVNKDEVPLRQGRQGKSPSDDFSSEEEDATVKPQKPTRYGRVPKPIQPLNYPSKEDQPSSASDTTPASPSASQSKPKHTAKRGKPSNPQSAQKSKKPKLVTLRSSKSDFSDDEDECQWEDVHMPFACSSSKDSDASVFVPASIDASNSEILEVDENMVELDILASMPDVLGISQDAMCPDSFCQQAQHETGTAEPCEHQLDLLVDVIDYLSTEHTEVSQDESYNEAAQTLLTIGNLGHVSQSASETAVHDCTTGTTSAGVKESSHLEEEIVSPELKQHVTSVSAALGLEATETAASLDLQSNVTHCDEKPHITVIELKSTCDPEPAPQLQSEPDKSNKNSPLTVTGRFSKVKPKPNLSRTARTAQPVEQTETSKEKQDEESNTLAPNLSQVSEPISVTQKMAPKKSDSAQASLKHDISMTEVKLIEESSGINERFDDEVESVAATSDQNCSVIQSSCSSESHSEPGKDQATRDAESTSDGTAAEAGLHEPSTSDSAMTEVVQESFVGSALVQESSDKCPMSPAENLSVSQNEGSKTVITQQSKRSRLPKVKPRPNLPQTSKTTRSKPQTTEQTAEKDSHPTPNPEFHKTAELQSQQTCSPPSTSQPPEELPASTEMKTCVEHVDQAVLDVAKPDLTITEIQNLPKVQLQAVGETSGNTGSTFSLIEENLTSHAATTETSSNNVVLTDLELLEPQVGQGLNVDSALAQEGSGNPAAVFRSVEEFKVSQEDAKAVSKSPSRRSRIQRIKPKPNLPQTSRAARSKSEITEQPAEQDSSPSPNPQQARILPSEKPSESTDPASLPELLISDPVFKTTDELSVDEEKTTRLIDQTDMEATTSDQSTTENQKSEVQLEPSREQTTRNKGPVSEFIDKNLISHTETGQSSCNKMVTFDSGIETQHVGQMSHGESASVQEQSDSPLVLPVRKQDVEAASACHLRRSRSLKPKPNLAQTSRAGRCKPQAAKEPVEKESIPNPELHKETTADMEPQQPCTSSPEKQSESSNPASVLEPFHATGHMAKPAGQMDIDSPTSDHVVQGKLNFPEVQLEHTSQQTTIYKESTSDVTDALHDEINESSPDQTLTESQAGQESNVDSAAVKEGSSNPATIITPIEHLQVTQDSSTAASACLLRRSRLQKLKPKPNLPQTSRAARSKPQTDKKSPEKGSSPNSESDITAEMIPQPSCSALPEKQSQNTDAGLVDKVDLGVPTSDQGASVKENVLDVQSGPVLELANRETMKTCEFPEEKVTPSVETTESNLNNVTSNFAQSVLKVTKDPVSPVQLMVKPQISTSRSESTDDTVTEVEAQPTCSTSPLESSTTGCASDSVPSLELTSSPTHTADISSAEEQLKKNVRVGQVLTSACLEQNVPQKRQRFPKLKPKPNLGSPSRITLRKLEAGDCCKPSEDRHMDSSSIILEESGGHRRGTKITVEKESAVDKLPNDQAAETRLASHEDVKMDMPTKVASSNNQPITNLTAASDVQSSTQDNSSDSRINPLFTSAASPTCSQRDSSVQSMDHTELTDSSKTSNKPQTRRGRLVKPKPNLRCSSRPKQPLHSTEADSDSGSQVVDSSVDEKPESELRPDHQESVETFTDKLGFIDSGSNDAQVSVGGVAHVASSQNTLTSSIERIQSYPLLSQILPEQVPSDPDEPFFILSLTEIPVSSTGEVLNSTAEHLSYLPVTDASKQQPIAPGESSTAGDGSVSDVPAPTSTKEGDATGVFNVKDISPGPTAYISEAERSNLSLQKDPVALQGNSPVKSEIVDSKETDTPPSKQRLRDSGRKAKLPGKSNTRKKKQMTPAATETKSPTSQISSTQDSDCHEFSVETVSGDKETLARGKELDTSLGLQTAQSGGRRHRNRKAIDFPSYVSETKVTPPGKAASQRAKVKTPSAAGKSSEHDVAPTQSFNQTSKKSHSTSTTSPAQSLSIDQTSDHRPICSDPAPSTSYSTEASASQEKDCAESCSLEEEPTVVSQYFFSDIFTEVEER
ncbi:transcription factor TFIIIB component B'' homolog [Melanotaenia boesemani]|uniref:transcription factor TFIIIB component B'' homolog n=1 Tax=Melanotaenia boesemani TaxID=1250792 RepID=UPI001C04B3C7|nr:transcription factor TFIIIB component B'' homolog [Melanotaenia boesemani]